MIHVEVKVNDIRVELKVNDIRVEVKVNDIHVKVRSISRDITYEIKLSTLFLNISDLMAPYSLIRRYFLWNTINLDRINEIQFSTIE